VNTLEIARICHEANRVLTEHFKDVPLQPGFDAAPNEMRTSSVAGVEWRLAHRGAPASAQHNEWMRSKLADGWTLGPTRDADLKTHPALVPYEQLPVEVQLKDKMFTAIVLAAG
jgi:hypothetical protein